jgi:NAD-dependent SIR2 family protein deacetylase
LLSKTYIVIVCELESSKMDDNNWKCRKCNKNLVIDKSVLDYLGNTFSEELPKCPSCGKVLIGKELAEGRMKEVEMLIEEK